jgi:uncharacterized protein (DUF1697 family)
MAIWIALLRGINVVGANSLPMKELAAIVEAEGCAQVRTYVQSGNVVFQSSARGASALANRIGAAIEKARGFRPNVMLLSVREMARAVAANPFPDAAAAPATLHLFFLSAAPRAADLASLDRFRSGREAFAGKGKVFYLLTPDGFGPSRLAKNAERLLRVDATARNWRTVTTLLDMARAVE